MVFNDESFSEINENSQIDIINSFPVLLESECNFAPQMVNVIYDKSHNTNYIKLEEMVEYSIKNGIYDGTQILSNIYQANKIPENIPVAFSVNESTLYADDYMVKTVNKIKKANFDIKINPISKYSTEYRKLTEALELDSAFDTFEESKYLNAYCENVLEDISDKAGKIATKTSDSVKDTYNNAKNKVSSGINALANKYASIKKAISEKTNSLKNIPAKARSFALLQINKLKTAANIIENKLQKAKKGK